MTLQIFTNEEFGEVRVIMRDGEPWFVGKDVANALSYKNSRDALAKHVADEDKNTVAIRDGIQGNPNMTIINESGFYSLVFSSELEGAQAFKRWVTSEVLPSIRKTGSYSIESKQYTPATNAVIDARLLADEIQLLHPGVQRGVALSKAVDIAEKAHNISLQALKELSPPAEHETGYLNATQIGERLGGIPPQAVNNLLAGKGMEYRDENKNWRLTELGKEYGEELPYTRNGHSGYQIRWSEKILDVLKS